MVDSVSSAVHRGWRQPGYVPFGHLSVFALPRADVMEIAIRCYSDGSGKPNDLRSRFLTLCGLIGAPDAWAEFESGWAAILAANDSPPWHSKDAEAFRNDFADWDPARLRKLQEQLLDFLGTHTHRRGIIHASCTVNLVDYRRARSEIPAIKQKPEELCAYHVAVIALGQLPDNPSAPLRKDGLLELFFDRDEPFRHPVQKEWEARKRDRSTDIMSRIVSIATVDHRDVLEIQAADLMAWSTNRHYTTGEQMRSFVSMLAVPTAHLYWDYEAFVREYGNENG